MLANSRALKHLVLYSFIQLCLPPHRVLLYFCCTLDLRVITAVVEIDMTTEFRRSGLRSISIYWTCFLFICRAFNQFFNDSVLSPDRLPARRPATVRSSSNSGQCRYAPSPKTSTCFRSFGVPFHNLGYQTNGTMIVRPSTRSTVSASLLTLTAFARASWISVTEELIPFLQKSLAVLKNMCCHLAEFCPAEPSRSFKGDGVQPELGDHVLPSHMYVWRFSSIKGHEEKSVWPYLLDCGHRSIPTIPVSLRWITPVTVYLNPYGSVSPFTPQLLDVLSLLTEQHR